jgi:integrase
MPIYKNENKYYVIVSINGKKICRRKYLGRSIDSKEMALNCERDLKIHYSDLQNDYKINDLFNLFEEYLFKKLKETSAKRYLYTFNNVFKKYFENRSVSEITRSYCEFINDSINNLPYKRIDVYIYVVKLFINFLSNYGLKINTVVFYKYKSSRSIKNSYQFYSLDEFNKLISVIDDSTYKLLFSLLFYYGLRIGELRGLQVKDFKNDRLSINKELSNKSRFGGQVILDPKTSTSFRYYPLLKNIEKLLKLVIDEKKLKSNDYLFINDKREKVIGETTIRRKLEEYCFKAKVKVIKIHEFRHSCATYLINNNIDPKDIANRLGHSSVDTTLRVYAHLLPVRKESIKKLFENKQ